MPRSSSSAHPPARISGCGPIAAVLLAFALPAAASSRQEQPWRPVGLPMLVDVPDGFGSFVDVDPLRRGRQVVVQTLHDPDEGRLRVVSLPGRTVLGEAEDAGFAPRAAFWAGWRAFAWGKSAEGAARLWTPAFDSARTLASVDPPVPCGSAADRATPLAGPYPVVIPPGAKPGGRSIASPATAFVYADPPDRGVRIVTSAGLLLGSQGRLTVARGGFPFEGAIFAYGTANGRSALWTPLLFNRSTNLVQVPFVGCTAPPSSDPELPPLDSITVVSSPDVAYSASATIGRLGGSLETVDAAGTRYKLVVPPGALGANTTLTITPAAVTGLEAIATASRFAVDLEPAGLTFAEPARLVVDPTGFTPSATDLAFGWEATGIELRPLRRTTDGKLEIAVPHFSGTGAITVRIETFEAAVSAAFGRLPHVGVAIAQIRQDAAGLPGTTAAVVAGLTSLYTGTISPALDRANGDLVSLRVAVKMVDALEILAASNPALAQLPVTGIPGTVGIPAPTTVGQLVALAKERYIAAAQDLLGHFVTPACDGSVFLDEVDWFVIPLAISDLLAQAGSPTVLDICPRAAVMTLAFPTTIEQSQKLVDGRLQGGIMYPASTPSGIPTPSGEKFSPQTTEFHLNASGAMFVGAQGPDPNLNQQTSIDGRLDFQLDRGDPESSRPLRVRVNGSGVVRGEFGAALVVFSQPDSASVALTAGPPTDVRVTFRTPPIDAILEPGGRTSLCVDVVDAENDVIENQEVFWTLAGPGSVPLAPTRTDSLGVACADYVHPAGVVTHGDTATVTATASRSGATGSDSVTLTPRWVSIALAARPASESTFSPATNTTVVVNPGELVTLHLTLTGPGTTASDPSGPLPATTIVQVDIQSGGGELRMAADPPAQTVLPLLDANGTAEVVWDPAGFVGDTTLRVSYPSGLTSQPGVFATVTFTPPTSSTVPLALDGPANRTIWPTVCGPHPGQVFLGTGPFVKTIQSSAQLFDPPRSCSTSATIDSDLTVTNRTLSYRATTSVTATAQGTAEGAYTADPDISGGCSFVLNEPADFSIRYTAPNAGAVGVGVYTSLITYAGVPVFDFTDMPTGSLDAVLPPGKYRFAYGSGVFVRAPPSPDRVPSATSSLSLTFTVTTR